MAISASTLVNMLCEQIKSRPHKNISDLKIIGIRTGGVWVAKQLADRLGIESQIGVLDISFYRDDFSRIGVDPKVQPTTLPWDVEDQSILLVDDILHSGRTIRAAMDQIFDFGRPSRIELAVLIARQGRELPIQADFVGEEIHLESGKQVKLVGPEPLEYVVESMV